LRYIRKQVTEFSKGVARKMIQRPVYFHVSHAGREDPRTHNPRASTANFGMGTAATMPLEAPLQCGSNLLHKDGGQVD
jgi:hypothetical protein